jgi:hypothetical protein
LQVPVSTLSQHSVWSKVSIFAHLRLPSVGLGCVPPSGSPVHPVTPASARRQTRRPGGLGMQARHRSHLCAAQVASATLSSTPASGQGQDQPPSLVTACPGCPRVQPAWLLVQWPEQNWLEGGRVQHGSPGEWRFRHTSHTSSPTEPGGVSAPSGPHGVTWLLSPSCAPWGQQSSHKTAGPLSCVMGVTDPGPSFPRGTCGSSPGEVSSDLPGVRASPPGAGPSFVCMAWSHADP